MLNEDEDIHIVIPIRWNSPDITYVSNEKIIRDWQGYLVDNSYKQQILLSNIPEVVSISASAYICHVGTKIGHYLLKDNQDDPPTTI